MLAPANSPREIYASAQLAARDFFGPVGDVDAVPAAFVTVARRRRRGRARAPARDAPTVCTPGGPARREPSDTVGRRRGTGVQILEFGSGAAGPIATRYFAEHGATVLRVESKTRPDFLRVLRARARQPARARRLADVRRPQRRQAQRHAQPEATRRRRAREAARGRVGRRGRRELRAAGDARLRARLRRARRDQARPRDGRARASTARPARTRTTPASAARAPRSRATTRSPAGPTASPSARAARSPTRSRRATSRPRSRPALLYRRRTGQRRVPRRVAGRVRDLQPGAVAARLRRRRRHPFARRQPARRRGAARRVPVRRRRRRRRPLGRDRVLDDAEWETLARIVGIDDPALGTVAGRTARGRCRSARRAWTRDADPRRGRASGCRRPGIEAVPVEDFGDLHDDPQLARARSLRAATNIPSSASGLYERNGFRLSGSESGYDRAGPTLGQDTDWVLGDLLGLDADAIAALRASGAVE